MESQSRKGASALASVALAFLSFRRESTPNRNLYRKEIAYATVPVFNGDDVTLGPNEPYGTPIERWRIYREYLQHEDDLIHQRLNWMLLLQGFLFAAYASMYSGLLASPLIKIDAPASQPAFQLLAQSPLNISPILQSFPYFFQTLRVFSFVLPVLGYSVGLFSLFGVQAARHAIKELESRWKKECFPNNASGGVMCEHFPGITGGGKRYVDEMDSPLPFGIPIALCLGWAFLGLAQAVSFSKLHGSSPYVWGTIGFVLVLIPLGHLLRLIFLRICRVARMAWRRLFISASGKQLSVTNLLPNLQRYTKGSWRRFLEYTGED